MAAPAEIRWEHSVSDFIDQLVDFDIRYLNAQEAIERLVHSGLKDRIAVPLDEVEGELVYWHPMPPLFPEMRPLHVFWTVDQDGGLTVLHVVFSR
jgi:hypothetical protein